MAFDIFVTDFHGNIEKSIPLYTDDYDFIMNSIEPLHSFSLLKRVFSDYYGENEIYLNELEGLKAEILLFNEKFESNYLSSVFNFINEFMDIVDCAIKNKKTIKFVGD